MRLLYKTLHNFAIKDKKYPLKAEYSGIQLPVVNPPCREASHDLNNRGADKINLLNGRKT